VVVFGRQLVLLCYLVWEVRVLGRKGGISVGVSIRIGNGVIVFLIHPDRRGLALRYLERFTIVERAGLLHTAEGILYRIGIGGRVVDYNLPTYIWLVL